ncbi:MAG TPA: BRO family protein [Pseudomonas sp.]|uniref:BRO family protein n=1 Tax=Pseudomonas sp. TaxID=306 RepID=UPI002B8CABAD|nr:BRO family protein [Pseudomonas sp.]HSX91089.1 BRO family protein [Pseudomonas sp.]
MQATAQVIPFNFEAREVRTMLIDGQPWFCATDVCSVLGYSNSRKAIADNCREAGVTASDISSGGQKRRATFISEGNLYRLIIKSRKEEAQRFESWVCDEVLPAIRKHGYYEDEHSKMQTLIGETIGTDGFHMLGALIKGKVVSLPSGQRRHAIAKIWSQTHAAFGVRSAADIPASQLDSARNFIAAYALEGEWLGREEQGGIHLNRCETQHLYLLMTRFDHMAKEKSRLESAARALNSQPLLRVFSQLHEARISLKFLDRRRDEIYAKYRALGNSDGGASLIDSRAP